MSNIFAGKRVLVTGATGFIGGHVSRRLLTLGAQVRVFARDAAKAAPLVKAGAELAVGDLRDAVALARSAQDRQLIFHFAGVLGHEFKSGAYYREVNVDATRRLAEAALDMRVERFVHASSIWAYGLDHRGTVTEASPYLQSGAPYSDTKRQGQDAVLELVRKRGLPGVVVQPSVVYGPYDETWTLTMLKLIRSGRAILPGGGRGQASPIYIDDLVDGILIVAEYGQIGEAYILCGPETVAFREFFEHLARLAGKSRLRSVPGWVARTAAAACESWAHLTGTQPPFTVEAIRGVLMSARYDGTKARALGFEPRVGLADGMERVAAWLRAEG
jgi:nucleoside-diphosphate-sugar epimerase